MSKRIVLFVHGLGAQSQLSALLHPLLSLTTHLETGMTGTQRNHLPNRLRDWNVTSVDIHKSPPSVELTQDSKGGSSEVVRFYEFNYAHLTEVIRDINTVSLERLLAQFHEQLAVSLTTLPKGNIETTTAENVIRIGDVVLASSAPMLGIFPFFAQYLGIGHAIKAYRRFFGDVATCAMDYPGADLLFAHFNRTVQAIFEKEGPLQAGDDFVIVAHSLGTVLTHGILVQRWSEGNNNPRIPAPTKVLTFGTAIGLLCWLWLFLDYVEMNPNDWKAKTIKPPGRFEEFATFAWKKLELPQDFTPAKIKWVNVLNRLDPIATKVSDKFIFFSAPEGFLRQVLPSGIDHRFILREWWRGFPHNTYFEDRRYSRLSQSDSEQFDDILMEVLGFSAPRNPQVRIREEEHWAASCKSLRRLAVLFHILGVMGFGLSVLFYSVPGDWSTSWGLLYLTPLILLAVPGFVVDVFATAHKIIWGSWSPKDKTPKSPQWAYLFDARKNIASRVPSQWDRESFFGENLLRRALSLIAPTCLLVLAPWLAAISAQAHGIGLEPLKNLLLEHSLRFSLGLFFASTGALAFCASTFSWTWREIVRAQIPGDS